MDILQKMLMNEKVDKDVSLSDLAKRTEDFTGSGNTSFQHSLNIFSTVTFTLILLRFTRNDTFLTLTLTNNPCCHRNHKPYLNPLTLTLTLTITLILTLTFTLILDLREVVRVACLQRAKDVVRRAREKMGKMVHNQGNLHPHLTCS